MSAAVLLHRATRQRLAPCSLCAPGVSTSSSSTWIANLFVHAALGRSSASSSRTPNASDASLRRVVNDKVMLCASRTGTLPPMGPGQRSGIGPYPATIIRRSYLLIHQLNRTFSLPSLISIPSGSCCGLPPVAPFRTARTFLHPLSSSQLLLNYSNL